MNLIIDFGNTRTKMAIFHGNNIINLKTYDNLFVCDAEFILQNYPEIDKCILSVTGSADEGLIIYLKNTFTEFIELTGNTPVPFKNKYESPATLGSDRIASIAGAMAIYPGSNVLVIDSGTAITFEFIDKSENYLGGNISPGLETRFKALHTFTNKLPLLSLNENFNLIGKNTQDAVVSGVQNGVLLEIDGYINSLIREYPDLKTILTGGDAEFLAGKLKSPIFMELNLVLIGLNIILEFNFKK